MQIAGIQNNIMRSSLVTEQQAHMDQQALADARVAQRAQLLKTEQANEHVRVINQPENQTIRSDHEHPETHDNPRKKKSRWRAFLGEDEDGDEDLEQGGEDAGSDELPPQDHPHLDIRV